ncbi:MAG: EamA family transporter [Terracidiphilus sp.]|jgi:drug/metabolite transporter (DMT)-like permease
MNLSTMANLLQQTGDSGKKTASTASIVLAFASVYFFWGSTYTAIRIGAADMPALLLAGTRFLIAGAILLGWCRWRGLRLLWPRREMAMLVVVGLLLLAGGNVGLVYGERYVPSGMSSLIFAVTPLYIALIEMALPGGEPLPARGWLGLSLGFAGLAALLWPTMHNSMDYDAEFLLAIGVLFAGALLWAVGSIVSRRAKLKVNTLVAASWQMLAAGMFCVILGTALGQWQQFHLTASAVGSLAWLITGGSLLGYTAYIYLLEHVPVSKVVSNSYVNPMVAVLLGILLLHERPGPTEFAGMVSIVVAVFLLTTAKVRVKGNPSRAEAID